MYRCTNCGHTMSYPQSSCPGCGVILSGVRCDGCGHTDTKETFINNNHRCPKCGSAVYSGGVTSDYSRALRVPNASYKTSNTNTNATWSLVLGILSLLCGGPITAIPAIICGHKARSQIRENAQDGNGMALAGLILGYLALVFTVIVIIAAIISPE